MRMSDCNLCDVTKNSNDAAKRKTVTKSLFLDLLHALGVLHCLIRSLANKARYHMFNNNNDYSNDGKIFLYESC